jgi:UDP-GlcNAc:undecaprenyl-phosphate GlcNAc-1-phosphate transferase
MKWWSIYLAILGGAFLISLMLTPLCRSLAWKWNFLDKPLGEGHKLHENAIPVLGGMALVFSWLITIGCGLLVMYFSPEILPKELQIAADGIKDVHERVIVIIGGAVAFWLIGLADDKKPMSAKFKLALQIAVMATVAQWGAQVSLFQESPFLKWLLTFSWLMVILNAINFYDNMDGLLCGVAAIAAFIFMVAAGIMGQYLVSILAAVTSGVSIGFYVFNKNPASIFMGDNGSHFIGYILGALGVMVTYYNGGDMNITYPFLVPFLVLSLPLFDLGAVVIIRLRNKKPIYLGDHNHISHRFFKMGFSRKHAVNLIHLLSFALGIGAIALLHSSLTVALLLLSQTAALLIFLTILHSRQKLNGNSDEQNSK